MVSTHVLGASSIAAGAMSAGEPPAALRAVRLLLHCLDCLRSARLDYLTGCKPGSARGMRSGSGGSVGGSGGSGGDGRRSRAGSAAARHPPSGVDPDVWPKVYCLDIDYVLVARAAARWELSTADRNRLCVRSRQGTP
eukprot:366034-Chlamydomonas_euryale.AAC.1